MIATSVKLITAATANAVTTAEAKLHLRVDFADSDQNTYIDGLVEAAQRQVEAYTGLRLNDTVYEYNLSAFPSYGIVLPYGPLKTLTSIKYYDADGSQQTWADTNYFYEINEQPPVIRYVETPPETYDYKVEAVAQRYGASHLAFIIVPLVCAFFIDLVNALLIPFFLANF